MSRNAENSKPAKSSEGNRRATRRWNEFAAAILSYALMMAATDAQEAPFIRGNVNADSTIDMADAVCILTSLFRGDSQNACGDAFVQCLDAADTNDEGNVDISDAIQLLLYHTRSTSILHPPKYSSLLSLITFGTFANELSSRWQP